MKIMRINYTNVSVVVALLVVSYVFFRLVQRSQLVTADTESVPQTSGTHNFFTCMVHHSLFVFVRRRQLRFRSIVLKKKNLANIAAYLISCMGNNACICIRLKFNTLNTKPKQSIGTVRLCKKLHTLDKVVSKTKHSKTKTEARSTQNSKTKHPNLENEAP